MAPLGTYEWAKATNGALTKGERRELRREIVRSYTDLLVDRMKAALGRVPEGARRIDPGSIVAPDSAFAREAETACAEQPQSVIGHSYRTWILGTALARLDGEEGLDPELFFVASLLHDSGMTPTTPGRCFTHAAAEVAMDVAERCGIDSSKAGEIADGICGHITPGATAERDGPLAYYVQGGAVADLAGLRRCDVSKQVQERAESEHPRGEVNKEISRMWRAEAKAVPDGRAALLERWARFSVAVRIGP